MKKFMDEFKQFIARGNVMDMAVGVIIGGAFTAITTSLINDIIMPLLGIFTGSISFAALSFTINGAVIQAVFNFLVMAFVVFCLIKTINRFHRKKKESPKEEPAPPEPSAEEKLLMEIRDLLKEKQ